MAVGSGQHSVRGGETLDLWGHASKVATFVDQGSVHASLERRVRVLQSHDVLRLGQHMILLGHRSARRAKRRTWSDGIVGEKCVGGALAVSLCSSDHALSCLLAVPSQLHNRLHLLVSDLGTWQDQLGPLPGRLLVVEQLCWHRVLLLLLQNLLVLLPLLLLLLVTSLLVHLVHPQPFKIDSIGIRVLGGRVVEPNGRPLLKGNLLVVVDDPVPSGSIPQPGVNPRSTQFTPLLKTRQPPRFFKLLLASFPLRLLALSVRKTRSGLAQHLQLVLVHVLGVGARWLRLWIGIDLARLELPRIIGDVAAILLALSLVQQGLVSLQALSGGPADDWSDGPPLCGHQLGQVEQLLVLLLRPLCLLERRIKPLKPTSLALFGTLPVKQ